MPLGRARDLRRWPLVHLVVVHHLRVLLLLVEVIVHSVAELLRLLLLPVELLCVLLMVLLWLLRKMWLVHAPARRGVVSVDRSTCSTSAERIVVHLFLEVLQLLLPNLLLLSLLAFLAFRHLLFPLVEEPVLASSTCLPLLHERSCLPVSFEWIVLLMVKRLIVQIPLVVVQILLLKLLLLLFARWRHVWWGNVMADMFFPLLAERVVDLLLLLLLELLLLSWCRLWGRWDIRFEDLLPLRCESLWISVFIQVWEGLDLLDRLSSLWMVLDMVVVSIRRAWPCGLIVFHTGWEIFRSIIEVRLRVVHLGNLLLWWIEGLVLFRLVHLKFHRLEHFLSFLEGRRLLLELRLLRNLLILCCLFLDLIPHTTTSRGLILYRRRLTLDDGRSLYWRLIRGRNWWCQTLSHWHFKLRWRFFRC